MTTSETPVPALDDTTHSCGSCGEAVPAHQEFCGQCGARQPAVAETATTPDATAVTESPTVPDAMPPLDLAAMTTEAAALVGQTVAFRSLSRRERGLRPAPDPDTEPLPGFVVGRCRVVESRGAWVLLEHSTGTRGWCPVNHVKPRGARAKPADTAESLTPSTDVLAMIEALERLHALHTSGGLTDEEFAQAKQRLLAER